MALTIAGSLEALAWLASPDCPHSLFLPEGDVVLLPTAAAFSDPTAVAVATSEALSEAGVRVEALMMTDRVATAEPYFHRRLREADVVVLCDGAALHARSVWRHTPVEEVVSGHREVVAIGSVATVMATPMIDPRGGAPTPGLGDATRGAVAARRDVSDLARTRQLLGSTPLTLFGPSAVVRFDDRWLDLRGVDVDFDEVR